MGMILVTGANRGIGLELACQYAEAGEQVIATARAPEDSHPIQHLEQSHETVSVEQLDVTDPASIARLAERLKERAAKLDLLINNAGMLVPQKLGEWTSDAFNRTFATNITGPAMLMQSMLPFLSEGSKVINVSSGMGSFHMEVGLGDKTVSYAASKAGLNMITAHAAAALRSKGVIVAAFSPGWVKTEMGGQEAELEVEESVAALRKAFEALSPEGSGGFFGHDGERLSW